MQETRVSQYQKSDSGVPEQGVRHFQGLMSGPLCCPQEPFILSGVHTAMFTGKLAVLMNPFTSVHKNLKVVRALFR